MSALWTPGRCGIDSSGPDGAGVTAAPDRAFSGTSYSKRVGIYWSRVVRTARTSDPHGVHPMLVQWCPTLVQCGRSGVTVK